MRRKKKTHRIVHPVRQLLAIATYFAAITAMVPVLVGPYVYPPALSAVAPLRYCRAVGVNTPELVVLSAMWLLPSVRRTEAAPL